ncbi:MAG: hypothetical protein JW795_11360 [Chitinivibrionales bacterium]|nr:hypothetical protein [Chitinivibrionales bacterium]
MKKLLTITTLLCACVAPMSFGQDNCESRFYNTDGSTYAAAASYCEEDFVVGDHLYRWSNDDDGERVLRCSRISFDAGGLVNFGPWRVSVNFDCGDYHRDYFQYCEYCGVSYCCHPHHGRQHHHIVCNHHHGHLHKVFFRPHRPHHQSSINIWVSHKFWINWQSWNTHHNPHHSNNKSNVGVIFQWNNDRPYKHGNKADRDFEKTKQMSTPINPTGIHIHNRDRDQNRYEPQQQNNSTVQRVTIQPQQTFQPRQSESSGNIIKLEPRKRRLENYTFEEERK